MPLDKRTPWAIARRTFAIFLEIDGEQRAASFAFYAVFSLFPLVLLVVSVGSLFIEASTVETTLLRTVESFIPLSEHDYRESVYHTVKGVFDARRGLGALAVLGLAWGSMNFFHALVRAVNRAWHTKDLPWWKVPVKNFFMLLTVASGLAIGIVGPTILGAIERFVKGGPLFFPMLIDLARYMLPPVLLFYTLLVLYRVSPRRKTLFREVWPGALLVTAGLKTLQHLLLFVTHKIWNVNAIYGAFGTLIVLLLWVYLCGALIILGGCFCAALGPGTEATEP